MNKKREIAKIVVGLTPVVGITLAVVEWFVVGTMEHGWLAPEAPELLREVQNLIGVCVLCLMAGLCIAVPIMGAREAVKAAKRLKGGT